MRDDVLLRAADDFFGALQHALAAADGDMGQQDAGLWSQRLIAAVRGFERAALQASGDSKLVSDGSYLLCTLGDELLTERLGLGWTVVSLLVHHHGDAHGGQRSWARLDALLGETDADGGGMGWRALLRLYERAIVLGMRGRYELESGGLQALDTVRRQVHDILRAGDREQPGMGDLVRLATRNLQSRRRWIGWAVAAALMFLLLILAMVIRQDIAAEWNDAADAMVRAATPAMRR